MKCKILLTYMPSRILAMILAAIVATYSIIMGIELINKQLIISVVYLVWGAGLSAMLVYMFVEINKLIKEVLRE